MIAWGLLKSPRNWALVCIVTLAMLFLYSNVARAAHINGDT